MKLSELVEMQRKGELDITYDKDFKSAKLLGENLTEETAEKIIKELGWLENKLHPYQIIDKTNKFIKGVEKHCSREGFLENTTVEFQNRPDKTYGRTFDRIVFDFYNEFKITVIYNMETITGKYNIYEFGKANSIAKCKDIKAVMKFINEYKL